MKTRIKKTVISGVSRQQMDEAFAAFAVADAQINEINAKMDVVITRLREENAYTLLELEKQRTDAQEILQVYASENYAELFGKKKSLETAHGTLGFRTGTPKLKTLKGFVWSAVVNLLKEFSPGYLRTIEEVDKAKLLSDRNAEGVPELMAKVGVVVDQDESFFIELKKEN